MDRETNRQFINRVKREQKIENKNGETIRDQIGLTLI